MRRGFGLLLLLALAASPARGQQALVGMYPAGVGVDSGQQATVAIAVDLRSGSQSLGAYQLQVSWDPAVLRYVRTTPPLNFGVPTVNESQAATGTLSLASALPQGSAGLFAIANITFEVLVASGSSPVTVISPEFTASGTFASIPVIATSGTICTSGGLFGDVSRDGAILSNDALLVVTAAVGLPITPYTLFGADVDADGDADTRDALIILSSAVGLPTTGFRVGQPQGAPCAGAPADSLAVFPVVLAIAAGETVQLTATLYDSTGTVTSGSGLAWTTDAGGVASVDSAGRVIALSNGIANIRAVAIGATSRDVPVTVSPRHIWYVDATDAATHTTHLGSFAYPLPDLQSALDAAAPNDTILVMRAATAYGPISITKPVTILGDSTPAGMPLIRNATGAAIVTTAAGSVVLRHLSLEESNAGLEARGDTLIVQAINAASLRGPAFAIRGYQLASLSDVHVASAVLAGVLADSTDVVRINGAKIQVIAQRNDSAAGIALLNGDSVVITNLDVLGVENGPGAVLSRLQRGSIDGFSVRAASGINADSVRAMQLTRGQILDGGDGQERPLMIHADTVVVDSVVVDGARRGVELSPQARDTVSHPGTVATLSRLTVRNVNGTGGVFAERFGALAVSNLTISNVQLDHGLEVRRVPDVQVDSATIVGIGEGLAINVDAVTGTRLIVQRARLRAHQGGIAVDEMPLVALTHVEVDSSAIPPQFCFGCASGWAIRVNHADSVRLDSLNVHDNVGGGVLVDSARIVVGRGTIVSRNQGFGGFGGGECEFGCQTDGTPPIARNHGFFNQSNVPGVVLNLVQTTHIAGWTVHDNSNGGLGFASWYLVTAPSATVDTSSFRGNRSLIDAAGNGGVYDAQLTVRGGRFVGFETSINVSYLLDLTVSGAVFDSAGSYGRPAIATYFARNVQIQDDTLLGGQGWGVQISSAARASVQRTLIRGRAQADAFTQEAAIELQAVDTGAVSQNRLELNAVRGIIVRNGSGPMAIDGNVVADDSGFAALQLHQPAVVTNNLITRNFNGVYITDAGGPSSIQQNNFIGNVFTAVRNESGQVVDATANWWNDPLGPRCSGVAGGCDPLSTGDIANGSAFGVDFSGFLTAPAAGAPIAAPRALPVSRRQTR